MINENFSEITNADQFFTPQKNSKNKRDRESLDDHSELTKKSCVIASPEFVTNMNNYDELKEFIERAFENAERKQEEFKNSICTSLDEIKRSFQSQIDGIKTQIATIENSSATQIRSINEELNETQARVQYNMNRIAQMALDCEVVAHGLPSLYASKTDELLSILNSKFNSNLNNKVLTSVRPVKNQAKQVLCTYFFTFNSKLHKNDFLASFNSYRFSNTTKKHELVPIEDVFEQFKGTNQAGKIISFKNSLTRETKAILDTALRAKHANALIHAWERDGRIYVRKNAGDKEIEALSIAHVNSLAK